MRLTKTQFLDSVELEIERIKKFATKEERRRLNIEDFNPRSGGYCIYGLLTGYCRNPRAIELIKECCTFVMYNKTSKWPKTFTAMRDGVTRKEETLKSNKEALNNTGYFSMLELYIVLNEGKQVNEDILAYLKGDSKTLNIT